MACTFSTSQLPKVLRTWGFFKTHNGLRTTVACNFPSLTRPDGSAPAAIQSDKILEKHSFATFLPFRAPWSSFYRVFLFWFFLFSDCSHHCCCICPQVESLISKLLSVISLFCRYYFPILALLFPNISYFPIISLLFPHYFFIMFIPVFHFRLIFHMSFWFRHYFVQIQSLPQLLWPLGDGMKAKPNNRYDLGMLYLLVIHPWELHPNLHYGSSHLYKPHQKWRIVVGFAVKPHWW